MDIAKTCDAGKHACAICIAQPSLDTVFGKRLFLDLMQRLQLSADGRDDFRIHIFHLVHHGRYSFSKSNYMKYILLLSCKVVNLLKVKKRKVRR